MAEMTHRAVDLVGVGINSLDTLIRLPSFPAADSKVQILETQTLPGGQVATVTVACRRWGLRTQYIGKIGDDSAGMLQRKEFEREGVAAHLVTVAACASQAAYILVDRATSERTILWQRDARLDLQPAELRPELITQARMLHVDGHPSAPAALAAQWARSAHMIVTADLDNLYPGVELLLESVDYLFSSAEFPRRLTGIDDLFVSLPSIRKRFGCKVAGATLGSRGALAWDGDSFVYVPAFRVQAVDTTGAGDLFHAGFDYALLTGEELVPAIEFGSAAAALNCTAYGARGGIHSIAEINQLISSGNRCASLFDTSDLMLASEKARAYS